MKKSITKYLSLIILFLFVGVTNVFANTSADANYASINVHKYEASNLASANNYLSHASYISIRNNENVELIFDYNESEESENEESSSSTTIVSFSSYLSNFFNAQLLSDLSAKLQKEANYYKPQLCQSSTRLHIRISVFII